MTDEDVPRSAELESLLGRARKASPPRARLASVRARLEAELGPLGPPPLPEPPATSAPPVSQTPSWIAPAGAVVVLALALLAIVAGPTNVEPAVPRPPSEPPRAATEAHESPENVGDPSDPGSATPAEGVAPAIVREEPIEPPAAERTSRAPRGGVSSDEPRDDPGHAVAEAGDEAARASQLREEIAILERAMGHRRTGDVEGARAAIAEHARRFPDGLLAPERARLASELE
jgi:hypothetical protein